MRHYTNEAPNLAEERPTDRVDPYWRDRAACRQKPTELFFPRSGANVARVAEFCRLRCPVMLECRSEFDRIEASRSANRTHGVVGGETVEERIARRRSEGTSGVKQRVADCPWPGTVRGVNRHRGREESACLRCATRARVDEAQMAAVLEAIDLAIRRGRSDHQIRLNLGVSGAVVAARRELVHPELLPAPERPCADAGKPKGWLVHRMRGEQNCAICEEKMASRRRGGRKRAEQLAP
ncbi:MAG: WhiB family transcriptional regulator [Sporichthyaceae bacterium]